MADLEIDDLASIGVVRDVPAYMLPPEAWSYGMNIRYKDGAVESLKGWTEIFSGAPIAAYHILPVRIEASTYWLYAGLEKIYVFDGVSHTDISRLIGGAYTAELARDWNSTLLASIPIFNNGRDVPQYWSALDTGTHMGDLPHWPEGMTAKVIRNLGPYLVALNITQDSDRFPHLVHWSHPADPGSIPSSWDYTDPTVEAGRNDLSDVNSGQIVDAMALQQSLFIYKETSTWRMDIIGGRFVMSFRPFLNTSGILAPRCVTVTGDGTRHVVATQDDIIVHNGNSAESIIDKRMRKYLFDNIDKTHYGNSFMFTNSLKNEVWFCYPEAGNVTPNKAIIWNYKEGQKGALSEADGITFEAAAEGDFEDSDPNDTWSGRAGYIEPMVGFWLIGELNLPTDYIEETAAYSNVAMIPPDEDGAFLPRAQKAVANGLRAVPMINYVMYSDIFGTLYTDWEDRIQAIIDELEPVIEHVPGFFISDEPYWLNYSLNSSAVPVATIKENMNLLSRYIHSRLPGVKTMWTDAFHIVDDLVGAYADVIPEDVDYIGMNDYLAYGVNGTPEIITTRIEKIISTKGSNQKLITTVDGFWETSPTIAEDLAMREHLIFWQELLAPYIAAGEVGAITPFIYFNANPSVYGLISMPYSLEFISSWMASIPTMEHPAIPDNDDTWEDDNAAWSIIYRRQLIATSPTTSQFFNIENGLTRDGVAFESVVRREGLAILGRKRSGEWIVDHENRKLLTRMWPKVRGGPVNVRMSSQETVNGTSIWTDPVEFDPETNVFCDTIQSGRAVGIEISGDGAAEWKFDGYKLDVKKLGTF